MVGMLKKIAFRTLKKKAIELHSKGHTVEQIIQAFHNQPKVDEGLIFLQMTDADLEKFINEAIGKE